MTRLRRLGRIFRTEFLAEFLSAHTVARVVLAIAITAPEWERSPWWLNLTRVCAVQWALGNLFPDLRNPSP